MTNNLQKKIVHEGTVYSLVSGKGQGQTIARFNGTYCPRAAVSQAIMVEAIIGAVPEPYRYFITHVCGLLRFTRYNLLTHLELDGIWMLLL